MTLADDTLLTLAEAAKLIPGADADTLKRMQRKGRLTCYRPGKQFLTTPADVREAVKVKCRVEPKGRDSGYVPFAGTPPATSHTKQPGSSSTALASEALALAREQLRNKKSKH